MAGVVTNPLSGVVRGMLTGWSLGQQLRQEARAQEAFEREKARQDEEAGVRDITNRMLLEKHGRPVSEAGTVEDGLTAPPGWFEANNQDPNDYRFQRKPDASRVVKYRNRSGQQLQYELLTPDEQMQRRLEEAALLSNASTMAEVNKLNAVRQGTGIELPPDIASRTGYPAGYKVLPAEWRTIADNMLMAGEREADRRQRKQLADEAGRRQTEIAEAKRKADASRAEAAEAGRNKRAREANATRLQLHNTPAAPRALTPNAEGVDSRFRKRLQEADQKELRQLQQDEQALHAEKLQAGEKLKQITQSLKGKDLSDKEHSDLDKERRENEAKLPALDLKIRAKQARQRQLVQKWAAPAAAAPRLRAADGKGNFVEWDGKAWVPVK